MYELVLAAAAKRSLKKRRRSGSFDETQYREVAGLLRSGETLPERFKDHPLQGGMSTLRECHLAFDLLLVYRVNEVLKTLTITNIGTHDELFG